MDITWSFLVLMLLFGSICNCHGAKEKNEKEEEIEILEELIDVLEKRQNGNNQSPEQFRRFIRPLIQEAFQEGKDYLDEDFRSKYDYLVNNIDLLSDTTLDTAAGMLAYNDYTPSSAEALDNETTVATLAYFHLLDRVSQTTEQRQRAFRTRFDIVREEWEAVFCPSGRPTSYQCDADAPYRHIDGSCNNLNNPSVGQAVTPQVRLVDPAYGDEYNLFSPRTTGKYGNQLPSARNVSRNFLQHPSDETPDDEVMTVALTAFGQFLDHDLTETPLSKGFYGAEIVCCQAESRFQCFEIEIAEDDPQFDASCMKFTRSSGGLADRCAPGSRQQLNALTSFIDGSSVYGSEEERTESLWDHNTGLLIEGYTGMPPNDSDSSCRLNHLDRAEYYCPKTGDLRGSEILHLTVMHTLFLRVHNRIAQKLREVNPTWPHTRVFEEARKIVGAILQHITYNEWLPLILGETLMTEYDLLPSDDYEYNPDENPSIINAFSTAAFRYGHTLVTKTQGHVNASFVKVQEDDLRDIFFDPVYLFEDDKQSARWVVTEASKASDRFIADDLANHLFEEDGVAFDLASLNVQRGRDHGLPSYTEYRKYFDFDSQDITDFDELPSHTRRAKEKLKETYEHVEDIDLFAGGLSERLMPGAHVGETFGNIIAEQFKRLKFGDRFWYENKKFGSNQDRDLFNSDQLAAIKNVTLSRLICVEFDLPSIQPDCFKQADDGSNERKLCAELQDHDIDFTLWEENNTNGGNNGNNGGGNNGGGNNGGGNNGGGNNGGGNNGGNGRR